MPALGRLSNPLSVCLNHSISSTLTLALVVAITRLRGSRSSRPGGFGSAPLPPLSFHPCHCFPIIPALSATGLLVGCEKLMRNIRWFSTIQLKEFRRSFAIEFFFWVLFFFLRTDSSLFCHFSTRPLRPLCRHHHHHRRRCRRHYHHHRHRHSRRHHHHHHVSHVSWK